MYLFETAIERMKLHGIMAYTFENSGKNKAKGIGY